MAATQTQQQNQPPNKPKNNRAKGKQPSKPKKTAFPSQSTMSLIVTTKS